MKLYYAELGENQVKPSDDVTAYKSCTKSELGVIIQRMSQLSETDFTDQKGRVFTWKDWGAVFSIPHQYVFDNYPTI
jgi:hypothetical protein